MNTPKWLFVVLVLWIGATIWSNALEPAKVDLIPSDISSTIKSMDDPSLVTGGANIVDTITKAATKLWAWVGNLVKALTFDYAWFDGWVIGGILRTICIIFSIASLYLLADLIIMVFRVVWAALGKFA